MHRILSAAVCLVLAILFAPGLAAITVDEVPNPHLSDSTRFTSNPAGILSPADVARIDSRIHDVWKASSAELVAVVVDRVDPSLTPEEFATRLFEKWGIGKSDKDDGVLLLVAVDDRAAIIRTGYGVEGVLPDALAGRIIRNDMFPHMREEDYAGGTMAGVDAIARLLTTPEAIAEIRSGQANNSRRNAGEDEPDFFAWYLWICGIVSVIALVASIAKIRSTRGMTDVDRWRALNPWLQGTLVVGFITIGGFLACALVAWKMHRIRRHSRKCPHCGTRMKLIDEVHDNDYLTPSQDLEERLNSVDYDVWRCPKCAQTDILPYINRSSPYKECPRCHARAMSVTDRRILKPATTKAEGVGADILTCRNCGNREEKRFTIAKKDDDLAVSIAVGSAIAGSRGGGGGLGGFGGGSFGGGLTGGGGAGGRW